MNKVDLIAKVTEMVNAEEKVLMKKEVAVVVDAMVEAIVDSLVAGEEVKVTGLGKFSVADRAERAGVNPQTKEAITIPARKAPKFTAYSSLKEVINA